MRYFVNHSGCDSPDENVLVKENIIGLKWKSDWPKNQEINYKNSHPDSSTNTTLPLCNSARQNTGYIKRRGKRTLAIHFWYNNKHSSCKFIYQCNLISCNQCQSQAIPEILLKGTIPKEPFKTYLTKNFWTLTYCNLVIRTNPCAYQGVTVC